MLKDYLLEVLSGVRSWSVDPCRYKPHAEHQSPELRSSGSRSRPQTGKGLQKPEPRSANTLKA